VVGGEVGRPDHAIAPAVAEPLLGGLEQGVRGLGVVLALEEPELAPAVLLELV
jgi:hypothetical protein